MSGWLRCGRHIRRSAASPDSSCESREGLHMYIEIDIRIEMPCPAGGRTAAAYRRAGVELAVAVRSMAEQGR